MQLDPATCERARRSRDPRFDGLFFVGVSSTGIFCRPICPAPAPKPGNVRYYPSAAAAARAGLRPCLRCRPESAPGSSAWNGTSSTVVRALRHIESGALDDGSVAEMAHRLGVGPRHLDRLFQRHVGASPVAVAQTRRLLFAKQLLDQTALGMAEVAFAAGFGSVRRFNQVIRQTYGCKPTELRRRSVRSKNRPGATSLTLYLPYRAPFDWTALISFLTPRAIPGVETITAEVYRRNIEIGDQYGRIEVRRHRCAGHLALAVDFPDSTVLLEISTRARRLFDLDSDPAAISAVLASDPLLAPLSALCGGLRVPGAWDGFELAIRAILGQQVTVRGATTLCGRLVEEYGLAIPGGFLFPKPKALAKARFSKVGIPSARAAALRALARACARGEINLEPGVDPARTRAQLQQLPGIGDWTAQYISMRALGDPDAFPSTDLGLLQAAGHLLNGSSKPPRPKALKQLAEAWRPWRAYGAMHLWHSLSDRGNP